jgi:hypothetical protein
MNQNDGQPFLEIVWEIREFVREQIAVRTGLLLSSSDDERTFGELGLDLALQFELAAQVSERFGTELTDFAAREHTSPATLARHVAHVLTGDDASAAEPETLRTGSSPPRAALRSELQAPLALAFARSIESE